MLPDGLVMGNVRSATRHGDDDCQQVRCEQSFPLRRQVCLYGHDSYTLACVCDA